MRMVSWKKKVIRLAPMAARGRISRGNHTFWTSGPLAVIEVVAAVAALTPELARAAAAAIDVEIELSRHRAPSDREAPGSRRGRRALPPMHHRD